MSANESERSRWREEFLQQQRCQLLGHPEARWVRRHIANDSIQICYWCEPCGRPVTQERYGTRGANVTASYLISLGIDPNTLPITRRDASYALCARCYATRSCEMHHTAMRAAFDDADEWPIIPLCTDCHLRFTQTIEAYVKRRIKAAICCTSAARSMRPRQQRSR